MTEAQGAATGGASATHTPQPGGGDFRGTSDMSEATHAAGQAPNRYDQAQHMAATAGMAQKGMSGPAGAAARPEQTKKDLTQPGGSAAELCEKLAEALQVAKAEREARHTAEEQLARVRNAYMAQKAAKKAAEAQLLKLTKRCKRQEKRLSEKDEVRRGLCICLQPVRQSACSAKSRRRSGVDTVGVVMGGKYRSQLWVLLKLVTAIGDRLVRR